MSLYNMLFGRNPASRLLLAMLNLTEGDVGRFRDCHLQRGDRLEEGQEPAADAPLRICVYTRNGGGNRDDYEAVTEALRALPEYVTDFDDDFDCTYASYIFKVPEKFQATAEELAGLGAESDVSPGARFKSLLDKLQKGDMNDPATRRAMEVGKEILGPVIEKLEKGESGKVEV